MKKNIIRILVAVFVLITLGGLYSTNHRLNVLVARMEEKEETTVEETKQLEETEQVEETMQVEKTEQEEQTSQAQGEYDTFDDYMQLIFPTDGNYYVEATGTVQFYADPDCTIEIESPRFLSPEVEYISAFETKTGYRTQIYVFLMEEEKICYCPAYFNGHPTLTKEN